MNKRNKITSSILGITLLASTFAIGLTSNENVELTTNTPISSYSMGLDKYPEIKNVYPTLNATFFVTTENGKDQLYAIGKGTDDESGFRNDAFGTYSGVAYYSENITPTEWNDWDDIVIKNVTSDAFIGTSVIVNDGHDDHLYYSGKQKYLKYFSDDTTIGVELLNELGFDNKVSFEKTVDGISYSISVGTETEADYLREGFTSYTEITKHYPYGENEFIDLTPESWTDYSINDFASVNASTMISVTNDLGEDELWSYGWHKLTSFEYYANSSDTLFLSDDEGNNIYGSPVPMKTDIDLTNKEVTNVETDVWFGTITVRDKTTDEYEVYTYGRNNKHQFGTEEPTSTTHDINTVGFDFEADGIEGAKIMDIGHSTTSSVALVEDADGFQYIYAWGTSVAVGPANGTYAVPQLLYSNNPDYVSEFEKYQVYTDTVVKKMEHANGASIFWISKDGEEKIITTGSSSLLGNGKVSTSHEWNEIAFEPGYDYLINGMYADSNVAYIVINDGINEHVFSWGLNKRALLGNTNDGSAIHYTPEEMFVNSKYADSDTLSSFPWTTLLIIILIVLLVVLGVLFWTLSYSMVENKHKKRYLEHKNK